MQNLIFIIESIPDNFYIRKIGIPFYKKKGVNVKILYIAGFTRANYYKKIKNKTNIKFFDGKNKQSIKKYLEDNASKDSIVFCHFRKNNKTIFINEFLNSKKIKTALVSMEATLERKKSFLYILKILISTPLIFLRLLVMKFKHVKNSSLDYNYVFTAGKINEAKYKENSNSRVFKVHHYDFDYFKNYKKFNKEKNYAVFLSPALTNPDTHDKNPGFFNKNFSNWSNDHYIHNIKSFLKKLSIYSNNKILIAEHPKEKFNLEKILKFKSYRGITADLIKNANFVICFDSNAYQLAVLFNKPIIFLTSKKLPKFITNHIESRCLFFNKYPIEIENDLRKKDIKLNLNLNKKIYKKFIKLYITNTNQLYYKYNTNQLILNYIKKNNL